MGWDQAPFPNGMPSATDLPPDLYVILTRVDFHCIWVSPAVLALLPSPFPPSPPGGHIPSPGVFCDAAVDLILPFLPPPTEEDKTRHLASAQTSLHSFGIVGVHDAGVTQPDRELYSRLADTATLTLRIYAMVECRRRNTFCPAESWKVEREDGMLTVAAVKLFADGALGSWGAALIEPYSDAPASNGTMLITPEELVIVTQNWRDAGWTVCIHAIGDAANRAALDAIEAAGASRAGYRIEHAQIVAPEDQVRMGRLRVTPSIQPTHATSDMYYAEARLGEKRLRERAYRMKSLLPMKPVLGSDFPVEPPSVLRGIYAAVTRRNPATGKGRDGGEEGWYQEETLSLREALGGFTRNVARAAGMGGKTGAVREGLWADWVVLGNRIDKGGSVEWLREEEAVRETWVAGKRVFVRET